MRSPTERALWTLLAVALVAGASAAWWTADQWRPHIGPWSAQAWRTLTRPGPPKPPQSPPAGTAPRDRATAEPAPAAPRKCVRGAQVHYTDGPCPPGYEERPLDGSALSSLPRAQ